MSNERDEFVKKLTEKFDTKLVSTTPIKNFPTEIHDLLEKLYSEKSLTSRLTATLLNGIFTEGRREFLMSQPLMQSLIQVDFKNENLDRETLNDKEYGVFVACLCERNIVEIIDQSEKFSGVFPKGKAGTWQLCDRYPLKLLKSLAPQELDEAGYPYLDLTAEEMHEQWINAGHAEHYERWSSQQIAKEIRTVPPPENLHLVQKNTLEPEIQKKINEIEDRKNGPMKFY